MALITRCPACGTAFRVTPLDLQAHGGDVRCGRCRHIFSGYASLAEVREPESGESRGNEGTEEAGSADMASETGSLAAEEPYILQAEAPFPAEERAEASGAFEVPLASGHPDRRGNRESATAQTLPGEKGGAAAAFEPVPQEHVGPDAGAKRPAADSRSAAWAPSSDAQEEPQRQTTGRDEAFFGTRRDGLSPPFDEAPGAVPESLDQPYAAPVDDSYGSPHPYRDFLAWGIGSLFLLLALAAQAVYAYRGEISAIAPGARPYIEQYCKLLQCGIPSVPQYAKLLNIESSDMRADPQRQGINILTALVHNYASYPQPYPLVQLTLIDAEDRPLASRTFPPPAYLEKEIDFVKPVAPNAEFTIGLHIDSGDLNAAGYRLLLLHPAS